MLLIVAALEHELSGLRRELRLMGRAGATVASPTKESWDTGLPARRLELHVIGVGRGQAESRVRALLSSSRRVIGAGSPVALLLVGFAGAVDPALRVGDLLAPERYYLPGTDSPLGQGEPGGVFPLNAHGNFLEAHAGMLEQSRETIDWSGLAVAAGNSLTVGRPVSTPEAKKDILARYPVRAVNMEDYWVAQAAAEAGAPFLAVRSVLDTAQQGLPGYLVGLAESPFRAALTTAAMPWRVPAMLRLAGAMRAAQGSLTRFALAFALYDFSGVRGQATASK